MPNISINIEILPQSKQEYKEFLAKNLKRYNYLKSVDEER